MSALHVVRMMPGGVVTSCHAGALSTDGPWLIVQAPSGGDVPDLVVPAHVVVEVSPCPANAAGTPCGVDR